MEIEDLVAGQLVRLIKDKSVVGEVRKISQALNVGIMVNGKIRWVKAGEIEALHG